MELDLNVALALGAVVLLIYYYINRKFTYFLSKPVPCLKPSFLVGNSGPTVFKRVDMMEHVKQLYNAIPESKIIGFYELTNPMYMLRDLDMIKKVIVKDFDYFVDHSPSMSNTTEDEMEKGNATSLLANSLFALRGQRWRDMRATLSPAFTGSKMRHMFELVAECAQNANAFYKAEARAGKPMEHDMKDIFSRFGNDVVATIAFGIKVDSFHEQENEFYTKGREMMNFGRLSVFIKFLLARTVPWVAWFMDLDFMDSHLTEYFKGLIRDNMKKREAHGIVRSDMINILLEVRKGTLKHQQDEKDIKDAGFATVEESSVGKSSHSRKWSDDDLIAQCFIFFLAGFDTLSTFLTFLSYELMRNPDVQRRLHEEIMETEANLDGKPLTYDILLRMSYMDMVVSEVLRMWPTAMVLDRYCVRDYLYDDGHGMRFKIEKGRTLWIPLAAIHRDPQYYRDPETFDPERFSEENRANLNPAAYFPFGMGPRNCIGSRLALMEAKTVAYYLLKDFSFVRTEKTQVPLRFKKGLFNLIPEKGVWMELKPRQV